MAGKTNIDTTGQACLIGLAEHLEEYAYNNFELREASKPAQARAHFIGSNMKAAIAKCR